MTGLNYAYGVRVRRLAFTVVVAVVGVAAFATGFARAEVTEVAGGAFGEQVRGIVSSGPLPSVTLPKAGGGPFTASAAGVKLPVLKTGLMSVSTEGGHVGAAEGFARSSAKVSDLVISSGVVSADQLTSQCRSSSTGSVGSVSAVNLRVSGTRVIAHGTVSIEIPGGKVVVNEQLRDNKTGSTAITVNALRVVLFGSSASLSQEIIVGQSRCQAKGSDINGVPTSSTSSTTTTTIGQKGCVSSCTIFAASAVPGTVDAGDAGADLELGVRFYADKPGQVTGIRFYKSDANTGVHHGNLWQTDGTLLATAQFTGETPSGWQQVNFGTPVAIAAGTAYIASYHTSAGHYSFDGGYFAAGGPGESGVHNAPLHAPGDAPDARNGVFKYDVGPSAFPSDSFGGANYWVDVVFTPAP
jgi:hypothetical protein